MGTFWVYAEELFFRGFLNDAMEDILGIEAMEKKNLTLSKKRIGGVTIVSFAFGFCHLSMIWAPLYMWGVAEFDLLFIIIAILGLSGMGFAIGILRTKTNSLFPAILCHSLGNFFEVLLISLVLFG
jgi:membrane protease YdiL (CAAX protease family)